MLYPSSGSTMSPKSGRPGYELTTFFQDPIRMARRAVELLLGRLAEPDAPHARAIVPATFVRRGSARLVVGNPA